MSKYIPVIGLEVHVELKTKSKMFCSCSADYFGKEPNSHTCPVCLGLPGALPVPNKTAIEWCVLIGQALQCEIALFSKFDRKNYFYPDLAKGYQISQYDEPFAINGNIVIARSEATKQSQQERIAAASSMPRNDGKKIRIRRVHMEEDTAKLVHQFGNQKSTPIKSKSKIKNQKEEIYSLIDFNRSGVPLVEIVTEPDFQSASEVVEYLKKLQQIVRYLGVSNADMEKGDMRLEPNISLRLSTVDKLPKYKVEVKNINSFRFVDHAIEYEIKRQAEILDKGETPVQETRGWMEAKSKSVSQRVKEEANDYRYFPEPDIPPIRWTKTEIDKLKSTMPELPEEKLERFIRSFGLSAYDAEIVTREQTLASYFEEAVKVGKQHSVKPKQIANAIINKKVDTSTTLPATLIEQVIAGSKTAEVDETELLAVIVKAIADNPKAVEDYNKGKENAALFLLGIVMRTIGKKIDAEMVKSTIIKELKK